MTLTLDAQAGRITPHIPVRINPGTQFPQMSSEKPPINVRCVAQQTVVDNGKWQSVLITSWSKTYFGDNYTPETRCQMVSSRLQNAVAMNGGTFKGMRFLSGGVYGQLVVCALGADQSECTSSNMLFTLKPENQPRVGQILEELTNFKTSPPSILDMYQPPEVDISDLDQELEGVVPSEPSQPFGSAPEPVP
ncbi:COP23 domain-containing protein [Planktothrix pseudagardhii]|uniref:COP23 domain-containing protein n=1 Tax=Planktothrix pseudagardhii TaxID=132604 RepID=UPI0020B453CC|nr:COP23 domain-containing protein [Planktothrix pseudagardhii]